MTWDLTIRDPSGSSLDFLGGPEDTMNWNALGAMPEAMAPVALEFSSANRHDY
jgi:hypothetical protein